MGELGSRLPIERGNVGHSLPTVTRACAPLGGLFFQFLSCWGFVSTRPLSCQLALRPTDRYLPFGQWIKWRRVLQAISNTGD